MDTVKTAVIIGTGMVAGTHLAALADLGGQVRLAGVVSRDAVKAEAFAKRAADVLGYPVRTYADTPEVAADSSVDFAIILTPPNARAEIIETLSAAGKHILMEKPIERTLDVATAIVTVCEARQVSLGIVFQHRVRAASVKLAELIADGTLGALRVAEAHVPWWRDQAYYDEPGRGTYIRDGGGVLISQAIHTLDLLLSLTGGVAQVQAMASTTAFHGMEAEDYVTAALRFTGGAVGSVIASTASYPGGAESITLQFDNACVDLRSGILKINWRSGHEEVFGAQAITGGGADPMAFTHDWHAGVIADFVDALNKGRPPMVTGREALKVHHLIDAIIMSSQQKRSIEVSS